MILYVSLLSSITLIRYGFLNAKHAKYCLILSVIDQKYIDLMTCHLSQGSRTFFVVDRFQVSLLFAFSFCYLKVNDLWSMERLWKNDMTKNKLVVLYNLLKDIKHLNMHQVINTKHMHSTIYGWSDSLF